MDEERVVSKVSDVSIIEPDSVRIGIKYNVIQFEFGQTEQIGDHEENFTVLSRVRLNPKYLKTFVVKMLEAGMEYEKAFKTDIGFTAFWTADKD